MEDKRSNKVEVSGDREIHDGGHHDDDSHGPPIVFLRERSLFGDVKVPYQDWITHEELSCSRSMEASGRKRDGYKTSLLCDPCKWENEDENAVAYCSMCNEYLCHGCRKAHTRAKATRNHILLDQNNMPQQKPTSDKESICPKHGNKPLEYYCQTHDQFSCSVCATVDHNQCSVQYIDDIAAGFHQSKEYVALEKATADLIRLLQETKSTATKNMKNMEAIHANFISDLQHFKIEINNKLDLLEKAAMIEVQILKDTEKKTLESIATRCDSMLSDIHNLSLNLKELYKYKQERQLVIFCKKAEVTVTTCVTRAEELSKENKIKDYKFEPNEKIRQFLDSLDSLGHMKETNDKRELNSQTIRPDICVKNSNQPTASCVGNIDVRHSTDKKSCLITGGIMMEETKLALVDRGNFSVKVADVDTNTLLSCIKLQTQPWDITCVNRGQIVVTCSDFKKGKLVFLKVGKSMSVLKKLDIGRNCQGVVYSNDTFIVSFDYQEPSVKIFDMKGKVLKTLKTNKAGGALFSDPWYISLSTDQRTVFVSDESNNTVTSINLDSTVQHVYTADSLDCPCGLAVDRNDNVYIAGWLSHNIHQISTDGKRSQVILDRTQGVVSPWMMTYCKTRHRLYISVEKDSSYGVVVYQLHT